MICSYIPGRIRLRSPRFKSPEASAVVIELLKDQAGIISLECNHNTGSLLIHYDPQVVDEKAAMEALAMWEEDDQVAASEGSGSLALVGSGARGHGFCGGRQLSAAEMFTRLTAINKDALEYVGMIGAFAICTSSASLRSKGLHIYSGLTLVGLTVQHIYKYRKRLATTLGLRKNGSNQIDSLPTLEP